MFSLQCLLCLICFRFEQFVGCVQIALNRKSVLAYCPFAVAFFAGHPGIYRADCQFVADM